MTEPNPGDITQLLLRFQLGDKDAESRLVDAVHGELRKLAAAKLRGERPDHSLQASALVNEAYIKLSSLDRVGWKNRSHFFGFAAHLMREILVDHARARRAEKRGGGLRPLELEEAHAIQQEHSTDILALDEALESLTRKDARAAKVFECRYFAGMSVEETAEALGIAPRTVKRDWQLGRAWLRRRLNSADTEGMA